MVFGSHVSTDAQRTCRCTARPDLQTERGYDKQAHILAYKAMEPHQTCMEHVRIRYSAKGREGSWVEEKERERGRAACAQGGLQVTGANAPARGIEAAELPKALVCAANAEESDSHFCVACCRESSTSRDSESAPLHKDFDVAGESLEVAHATRPQTNNCSCALRNISAISSPSMLLCRGGSGFYAVEV